MVVHTVHRFVVSAFFLGILIIASLPSTLGDDFTSPSNSQTDLSVHYTLGETVTIAWETSLSELSLYVAHWGGNDVGSLLTDATNANIFVWTIGESDNINAQLLSGSSNYVLVLADPSGQTGTGNGFVNGQLQSRGFVIDATNSSSPSSSSSSSSSWTASSSTSLRSSHSSSSSSAALTSSSSPTSASTSTYAASTQSSSATSAASTTGLSTGAKAGIDVGAVIAGLTLIAFGAIATVLLSRRRWQKRKARQHQHATVLLEDKDLYFPLSDRLHNDTTNKQPTQSTYRPVLVNELSDTSSPAQTRYELGNGSR